MAGTGERAPAPRLGAVGPLQPGDPSQVGRYQLSGRLGAGGMGTVYLGRADSGGPLVAVKVVHPELAGDPEFRARFADEVAAARRVAPFCTARVVDADPAAHPPWLVTEYVDGVPLRPRSPRAGRWTRRPCTASRSGWPPRWPRCMPPGLCTATSSPATCCSRCPGRG